MALRLQLGQGATSDERAPAATAVAEERLEARESLARAGAVQERDEQPALLDEVLIEEISIDGMCGVY